MSDDLSSGPGPEVQNQNGKLLSLQRPSVTPVVRHICDRVDSILVHFAHDNFGTGLFEGNGDVFAVTMESEDGDENLLANHARDRWIETRRTDTLCQIPLDPQKLTPGQAVWMVLIRPWTRLVSRPFSILVEQHEESNKFCPCQNVAQLCLENSPTKSKAKPPKSDNNNQEGPSPSGSRQRNTSGSSTEGVSRAKKMRQEESSQGLGELFNTMLCNQESSDSEDAVGGPDQNDEPAINDDDFDNGGGHGSPLPELYADPEPALNDAENVHADQPANVSIEEMWQLDGVPEVAADEGDGGIRRAFAVIKCDGGGDGPGEVLADGGAFPSTRSFSDSHGRGRRRTGRAVHHSTGQGSNRSGRVRQMVGADQRETPRPNLPKRTKPKKEEQQGQKPPPKEMVSSLLNGVVIRGLLFLGLPMLLYTAYLVFSCI